MGLAIKRADGTYRAWMQAKDVALEAGDVWEERAAMPIIGPSLEEQAAPTTPDPWGALSAQLTKAKTLKEIKAVIQSILDAP